MACLEAERVLGEDQAASISGVTPLRTLAGFTHVTGCGQDHRPAERHPGQGQRLTQPSRPLVTIHPKTRVP
jgi:hypothetical protein